jgi:hypothetical protein
MSTSNSACLPRFLPSMERLGGPKRDKAWNDALGLRLRTAWELALAEPLGVCIPTTEPETLVRHLYIWRRRAVEAGDQRFNDFAVVKAPSPGTQPTDEVWIIPRARAHPEATTP